MYFLSKKLQYNEEWELYNCTVITWHFIAYYATTFECSNSSALQQHQLLFIGTWWQLLFKNKIHANSGVGVVSFCNSKTNVKAKAKILLEGTDKIVDSHVHKIGSISPVIRKVHFVLPTLMLTGGKKHSSCFAKLWKDPTAALLVKILRVYLK